MVIAEVSIGAESSGGACIRLHELEKALARLWIRPKAVLQLATQELEADLQLFASADDWEETKPLSWVEHLRLILDDAHDSYWEEEESALRSLSESELLLVFISSQIKAARWFLQNAAPDGPLWSANAVFEGALALAIFEGRVSWSSTRH